MSLDSAQNCYTEKKILDSTRCSRQARTSIFCFKRFGFVTDVDKSLKENMREVLSRRIAVVCFNECNNMEFHDLSRTKVGTATHNLTSMLELGPTFFQRVL